jgi:hypothetical protein
MSDCKHKWGYGGDCERCSLGIVDAYNEQADTIAQQKAEIARISPVVTQTRIYVDRYNAFGPNAVKASDRRMYKDARQALIKAVDKL